MSFAKIFHFVFLPKEVLFLFSLELFKYLFIYESCYFLHAYGCVINIIITNKLQTNYVAVFGKVDVWVGIYLVIQQMLTQSMSALKENNNKCSMLALCT